MSQAIGSVMGQHAGTVTHFGLASTTEMDSDRTTESQELVYFEHPTLQIRNVLGLGTPGGHSRDTLGLGIPGQGHSGVGCSRNILGYIRGVEYG